MWYKFYWGRNLLTGVPPLPGVELGAVNAKGLFNPRYTCPSHTLLTIFYNFTLLTFIFTILFFFSVFFLFFNFLYVWICLLKVCTYAICVYERSEESYVESVLTFRLGGSWRIVLKPTPGLQSKCLYSVVHLVGTTSICYLFAIISWVTGQKLTKLVYSVLRLEPRASNIIGKLSIVFQ